MFTKCSLHLEQRPTPNSVTGANWVELLLLQARLPPLGLSAKDFSLRQHARALAEGFAYWKNGKEEQAESVVYWGEWGVGGNSRTMVHSTHYSIGTVGTAKTNNRFWIYSIKTHDLLVLERGQWPSGNGGPLRTEFHLAVELRNAGISAEGVAPLAGKEEQDGWAEIGTSILNKGLLHWRTTR